MLQRSTPKGRTKATHTDGPNDSVGGGGGRPSSKRWRTSPQRRTQPIWPHGPRTNGESRGGPCPACLGRHHQGRDFSVLPGSRRPRSARDARMDGGFVRGGALATTTQINGEVPSLLFGVCIPVKKTITIMYCSWPDRNEASDESRRLTDPSPHMMQQAASFTPTDHFSCEIFTWCACCVRRTHTT